jgi:FkbM family methyltransferase
MNINPNNLGSYKVPKETIGGICIDIGCNVGCFTERYIDHFKQFYCYEPLKDCFDVCYEKFKNYEHISLYNLAVYSHSNLMMDLLSHNNNDSGSSAVSSDILNDEWEKTNVVQSVNTISLFDILNNIKDWNISYLKSDCETSEYHIFLDQDLSRIEFIGMEIHWQMGESKQNELMNHILKTHNLVDGIQQYVPMNKEILFHRR